MMTTQSFSRDWINDGVKALDNLCRKEYQVGLIDLLKQPDKNLTAERLQRLTGILLKRPFAKAGPLSHPKADGTTREWWREGNFEDPRLQDAPELDVLNDLRGEESWQHFMVLGSVMRIALLLSTTTCLLLATIDLPLV